MKLTATPLLLAASLFAFAFCSSAAAVEKSSIARKPVTIKVSDRPAPRNPWLLVGEFPGQRKAFQDGLVQKGWHVVHVGVSNQFGSARAMDVWEMVYEEMHGKRGLSAKPALLGISRRGLYVTAWTRLHPDRASVLYLDNGVCDIRSWSAGFPFTKQGKGSPKDWELCKTELGYTSTGCFNKGVDHVGDLAVIAHAVREFGFPETLKISVHSGSDKFPLYPIIRRLAQRSARDCT